MTDHLGMGRRDGPRRIESGASMTKGRIICAFPATGKTWVAGRRDDVMDSDSSAWSWQDQAHGIRHPNWPENYVRSIRNTTRGGLTILCSTHEEVRKALAAASMRFVLVYPSPGLQDEYIERLTERGSPPALIEVVAANWHAWISSCNGQPEAEAEHIILHRGEYLSDAPLWGRV